MIKYKVCFIGFDPKTLISRCRIQTIDGEFEGISLPDEFDKNYISTFFGCDIAEFKAIKKAIKARIKKNKNNIKAMQELKKDNAFLNDKTYEKRIDIEITKYQKNIINLNSILSDIEYKINYYIKSREGQIKKIFNLEN